MENRTSLTPTKAANSPAANLKLEEINKCYAKPKDGDVLHQFIDFGVAE